MLKIDKEIEECYRRTNIPQLKPEEKMYYYGKIESLQIDKDDQSKNGDLMKKALALIESDDIEKRAYGCGMLYNDPLHDLVDKNTFSLINANSK